MNFGDPWVELQLSERHESADPELTLLAHHRSQPRHSLQAHQDLGCD